MNNKEKIDTQLSTNINDSLYNRVVYETNLYDNAFLAAIDHLKMAHSHLFEEFEGQDHRCLLSEISQIIDNLNSLIQSK